MFLLPNTKECILFQTKSAMEFKDILQYWCSSYNSFKDNIYV